jgi:peptidoglycan/LPS O-acetylase OafA/YrhL
VAQRRRLIGLDGIRGLAALYVVLHHTFLRSFPGYPRDTAPWWAGWLIYGRFAVVVFIVLSGFSLAVSPARHDWRLDGVSRFAWRRAWRILPPYWAALTFSLLAAWFVVPQPGSGIPDARSAIVNGLLLQDFIPATTPNRAYWTIAIEAHLYIVFPLLVLIVRRFTAWALLALTGVAVAVAAAIFTPVSLLIHAPDLGALFAIGVVAAGILRASPRIQALPWDWFALVAVIPPAVLIGWKGTVWTNDHFFWADLALGPAIGCLLAAMATGRPAPLVRLLDTAPLRRLGSFSYSLYLTHAPIVVGAYFVLVDQHFRQGVPSFLASLAIGVPLAVGFAWLFATVFELPFQRYRGWAALRAGVFHRPSTVDARKVSYVDSGAGDG